MRSRLHPREEQAEGPGGGGGGGGEGEGQGGGPVIGGGGRQEDN